MGYSWKKVNKSLTAEQRERGVIFSSVLVVTNHPELKPVLHEVMADEPNSSQTIQNLRDVSFFKNMAKTFGYKVIEEVRS